MLARHALLPPQATKAEIALSETMDRTPELLPGLNALRDLKDTPTASVVPYLISEYGLEEIEEFFPVRAQAIAPGIKWRRLIGTPEAVRIALTWIGYRASIEDQWIGRRRWNTFQFRFPTLPANDAPDLGYVARIAEISTALRSHFRRGVFLHDVGALDGDTSALDGAMLDRESGHALAAGGPIWSFGRTVEITHAYSEDDGTALDNWISTETLDVWLNGATAEEEAWHALFDAELTGWDEEDTTTWLAQADDELAGWAPIPEGNEITWASATFPWENATFPWDTGGASARRTVLAGWFVGRPVHACLKTAAGAVIGYQRCRAVRPVRSKVGGPYSIGADGYEPKTAGEILYIEAQTPFGAAEGVSAASVSLVVDGAHAPGVPPGRGWLWPDELIGGAAFAETPIAIPLRATVRDRIKFLVNF